MDGGEAENRKRGPTGEGVTFAAADDLESLLCSAFRLPHSALKVLLEGISKAPVKDLGALAAYCLAAQVLLAGSSGGRPRH